MIARDIDEAMRQLAAEFVAEHAHKYDRTGWTRTSLDADGNVQVESIAPYLIEEGSGPMTPRILSVEALLNGWLDHAFACYDFPPRQPSRAAVVRAGAFKLGAALIAEGVPTGEAVQEMFDFVDKGYVTIHTRQKQIKKSPQILSCKKTGARRLADWIAP